MSGRRTRSLPSLGVALLMATPLPSVSAATSSGWLDPGFGTRGFVSVPRTTAARAGCGQTVGLTIAATGRIFVGAVYCGTDPLFTPSEAVAFTSTGRIDRAFRAGRPLLVTAGDGAGDQVMLDLFATGSGGLVAYVLNGPSSCNFFMRFGPSGSRDSAYGRGCLPTPPGSFGGAETTRLPGGSMRACARDVSAPVVPVVLTGLTPDGTLDTRLGPDGYRPVDFDTCVAFTSDAAGRLYWVSRRSVSPERAVIDVHRTTQTGTLDTAWGAGGLATIELAGQHLKPVEAVAAADGSLLIGLGISNSPVNASWRAGVARLTPGGTVDSAFGSDGVRAYVPPGTNASKFRALTVDAAGRPIVSVSVPTGTPTELAFLVRGRATDGAPDPSFGVNGWVSVSRTAVDLAMASPSRILAVSAVRDGVVLSARRN